MDATDYIETDRNNVPTPTEPAVNTSEPSQGGAVSADRSFVQRPLVQPSVAQSPSLEGVVRRPGVQRSFTPQVSSPVEPASEVTSSDPISTAAPVVDRGSAPVSDPSAISSISDTPDVVVSSSDTDLVADSANDSNDSLNVDSDSSSNSDSSFNSDSDSSSDVDSGAPVIASAGMEFAPTQKPETTASALTESPVDATPTPAPASAPAPAPAPASRLTYTPRASDYSNSRLRSVISSSDSVAESSVESATKGPLVPESTEDIIKALDSLGDAVLAEDIDTKIEPIAVKLEPAVDSSSVESSADSSQGEHSTESSEAESSEFKPDAAELDATNTDDDKSEAIKPDVVASPEIADPVVLESDVKAPEISVASSSDKVEEVEGDNDSKADKPADAVAKDETTSQVGSLGDADTASEEDANKGTVTTAPVKSAPRAKRGSFAAIGVAILLALSLIVGAAYAYWQNNKNTTPSVVEQKQEEKPEKNPATADDIQKSIDDINGALKRVEDTTDFDEAELSDTNLKLR